VIGLGICELVQRVKATRTLYGIGGCNQIVDAGEDMLAACNRTTGDISWFPKGEVGETRNGNAGPGIVLAAAPQQSVLKAVWGDIFPPDWEWNVPVIGAANAGQIFFISFAGRVVPACSALLPVTALAFGADGVVYSAESDPNLTHHELTGRITAHLPGRMPICLVDGIEPACSMVLDSENIVYFVQSRGIMSLLPTGDQVWHRENSLWKDVTQLTIRDDGAMIASLGIGSTIVARPGRDPAEIRLPGKASHHAHCMAMPGGKRMFLLDASTGSLCEVEM
jgi:hypothetical protein